MKSSLKNENDYGLDSLTPPTADLNCAPTSLIYVGGWVVLGSFQCRGVLLLWHMVGQGPAVPTADAGRVGCFFLFFSSRLSYLPFLMPHLCGDGWTY